MKSIALLSRCFFDPPPMRPRCSPRQLAVSVCFPYVACYVDYQIQGSASVGSFVSGRTAGDPTQFTTLIVGPPHKRTTRLSVHSLLG